MNDPLRSPLALGGGGFGGLGSPPGLIGSGLDAVGASKVLTRALNLGMTLIDTAHSYAGGESERMIGSWLAADPRRRNHVALVDKLGVMVGDGGSGSTSPRRRCTGAPRRAEPGWESSGWMS